MYLSTYIAHDPRSTLPQSSWSKSVMHSDWHNFMLNARSESPWYTLHLHQLPTIVSRLHAVMCQRWPGRMQLCQIDHDYAFNTCPIIIGDPSNFANRARHRRRFRRCARFRAWWLGRTDRNETLALWPISGDCIHSSVPYPLHNCNQLWITTLLRTVLYGWLLSSDRC